MQTLVTTALGALIRMKCRHSHPENIRGSSPAKMMKVLAKRELCVYLSDAASCTEITLTNNIKIRHMQIKCLPILMRVTPSY